MPDFIFKKACHGYFWLIRKAVHTAAWFPATFTLQCTHISVQYMMCAEIQHTCTRGSKMPFKNTSQAKRERGDYQHKPHRGNLSV